MRCRRRQSSTYPSWSKIVASVALTFFAYLGFSVVTFTAGDLSNPARSLPRAMYPLGITAFVYVAVSLGIFGTLPVDEVIEHGDTALAEAARPVLGDAGFTIMAITALLATASSVNSNVFAAGNLTLALSELARHADDEEHDQRHRAPARGDRAEVEGIGENEDEEDGDRHSSRAAEPTGLTEDRGKCRTATALAVWLERRG